MIRVLAVLCATVVLSACGSSGKATTQPASLMADPAGGSTDYVIGPGDRLNVFVWRNPEVSATIPVRPDGKISTPLVEDLVAVGKTPSQLAREVEAVLAEYIKNPNVTVIVDGFVGTFSEQIRVVGQAAEPRAIPYRDRMTLLDVLIEVGGLTPQAAGNRAKVIRRDGAGQVEIRVRLNDLLNKGQISENISLRPGDVLIIPESIF